MSKDIYIQTRVGEREEAIGRVRPASELPSITLGKLAFLWDPPRRRQKTALFLILLHVGSLYFTIRGAL